jgi:predicted amidophosphoribosyltransferase
MLLSSTLLHFHRLPLLLVHRNKNTTPQRSGQSNLEKAEVKNAFNGR